MGWFKSLTAERLLNSELCWVSWSIPSLLIDRGFTHNLQSAPELYWGKEADAFVSTLARKEVKAIRGREDIIKYWRVQPSKYSPLASVRENPHLLSMLQGSKPPPASSFTASTHSHHLRFWFSALKVAPAFTLCELHEVIQIKKGIRFGVHTVLEWNPNFTTYQLSDKQLHLSVLHFPH